MSSDVWRARWDEVLISTENLVKAASARFQVEEDDPDYDWLIRTVKDFREDADGQRNVAVVVGMNGSGKTYDVGLLMMASLVDPYTYASSRFRGPSYVLEAITELLSESDVDMEDESAVQAELARLRVDIERNPLVDPDDLRKDEADVRRTTYDPIIKICEGKFDPARESFFLQDGERSAVTTSLCFRQTYGKTIHACFPFPSLRELQQDAYEYIVLLDREDKDDDQSHSLGLSRSRFYGITGLQSPEGEFDEAEPEAELAHIDGLLGRRPKGPDAIPVRQELVEVAGTTKIFAGGGRSLLSDLQFVRGRIKPFLDIFKPYRVAIRLGTGYLPAALAQLLDIYDAPGLDDQDALNNEFMRQAINMSQIVCALFERSPDASNTVRNALDTLHVLENALKGKQQLAFVQNPEKAKYLLHDQLLSKEKQDGDRQFKHSIATFLKAKFKQVNKKCQLQKSQGEIDSIVQAAVTNSNAIFPSYFTSLLLNPAQRSHLEKSGVSIEQLLDATNCNWFLGLFALLNDTVLGLRVKEAHDTLMPALRNFLSNLFQKTFVPSEAQMLTARAFRGEAFRLHQEQLAPGLHTVRSKFKRALKAAVAEWAEKMAGASKQAVDTFEERWEVLKDQLTKGQTCKAALTPSRSGVFKGINIFEGIFGNKAYDTDTFEFDSLVAGIDNVLRELEDDIVNYFQQAMAQLFQAENDETFAKFARDFAETNVRTMVHKRCRAFFSFKKLHIDVPGLTKIVYNAQLSVLKERVLEQYLSVRTYGDAHRLIREEATATIEAAYHSLTADVRARVYKQRNHLLGDLDYGKRKILTGRVQGFGKDLINHGRRKNDDKSIKKREKFEGEIAEAVSNLAKEFNALLVPAKPAEVYGRDLARALQRTALIGEVAGVAGRLPPASIDAQARQKDSVVRRFTDKAKLPGQLSAKEHDAWRKRLRTRGFVTGTTAADGDCLFHAFTQLLYAREDIRPETAWILRALACQQILRAFTKPEDREWFIQMFNQTPEEYVEKMKKSGAWAGELEIQALCDILRINVSLWYAGEDRPQTFESRDAPKNKSYHIAFVSAAGEGSRNHYEPMLPKTIKPLQRVSINESKNKTLEILRSAEEQRGSQLGPSPEFMKERYPGLTYEQARAAFENERREEQRRKRSLSPVSPSHSPGNSPKRDGAPPPEKKEKR